MWKGSHNPRFWGREATCHGMILQAGPSSVVFGIGEIRTVIQRWGGWMEVTDAKQKSMYPCIPYPKCSKYGTFTLVQIYGAR